MFETYDREVLGLVPEPAGLVGLHPRLGIVGGGQLARMTAMAALRLGCDVVVLERESYSPAARLATHSLVGDWNDPGTLRALASRVDVVTLENEFVEADALRVLADGGCTVWPGPQTVGLVQDKLQQKQRLADAGLPVPRLRAVDNLGELEAAAVEFGLPLVLKARRNAYDGKGNATLGSRADFAPAWQRLGGGEGRALFVEAFCDFTTELAVIITRGQRGELAIYPVVETVQRNHVCHRVRAPAPVPKEVAARVTDVARRAVEAVGAVGSFGVELFLTRAGDVLVNELAPRVHNSGHYSLEACVCSQFENHVRAVFGWPLGSTRMVVPAAVMVNLLGAVRAPGRVSGLEQALAVPGARVHLYGKAMSGVGRKLGHVTALGSSLAEAEVLALRCARAIRFGGET